MTCASCATRVGKGLERLPGVREVQVNLATERAAVVFDRRGGDGAQLRVRDDELPAAETLEGGLMEVEEIVLVAPDMSCAHCEATIRKALGREAAVSRVDIDLPAHRVAIRYDGQSTTLVHLRAVLDEVGYPTTVTEA